MEQMSSPESTKYHPFLHGELFHAENKQNLNLSQTEIGTEQINSTETTDKYSSTFYTRRHGARDFTEAGIAKYNLVESQDKKTSGMTAAPEVNYLTSRPSAAMHFGENPIFKASIESHKKTESHHEIEKEKHTLIELLESGDLENIENFLLDEKTENQAFQLEIKRVRNEYSEDLSQETFLGEKEWRILTALEIFDKATFEHCLRTFTASKEIISAHLPNLAKEIEKEGVTLEQFYRACLFHDLGKFAIPKFILDSKYKDEFWTSIFMDVFSRDEQDEIFMNCKPPLIVPDKLRDNPNKFAELHEFFKSNQFRAVTYVPANRAFTTDDQLKNFNETKRGINGNMTLVQIFEPHEKNSKKMLKRLGYWLEAQLAGHHHNSNPSENPEIEDLVATSALQVIIEISSDAIHAIDIWDALTSKRSYADDFSHLEVFGSIIHHAEIGRIKNKWVAATIINAKLKMLDENFSQEDKNLNTVRKFLEKYLPEDETSYFKSQKTFS